MSLLDRRLLVVTGKGGVGKTTVSAALAELAASRGKRVLVCEVNTQERISGLFGARPVGTEIRPIARNVDAVVVRPRESMRQYGLQKLKYRPLYAAVFENRLVSRFLRFIPSLPELVMLGKVLHHVREAKWDLVVVDAPATGHGITFLRVPRLLVETLPPGPMRSDGEWMQALLVDPAVTAVNLVALPEELPVNETLELAAAVDDPLRMPRGKVFLNRYLERLFSDGERASLQGVSGPPLFEAVARAASIQASRADRSAFFRERLERELDWSLLPLPFLHQDEEFGRSAITTLARAIGEGL